MIFLHIVCSKVSCFRYLIITDKKKVCSFPHQYK